MRLLAPAPLAPALVLAFLCVACGGPECPPPEVRLPPQEDVHPWVGPGSAQIIGRVGDREVRLLLDTGFAFSAATSEVLGAQPSGDLSFTLGALRAGPLAGRVLTSGLAADAVLGADVLFQVPLRHDARARTTTVLPRFEADPAGSIPLVGRSDARDCEGRALRVSATVEGREVTLLVDTGASATFLRGGLLGPLDDRATLEGLPVHSGFAGPFTATATRARALRVGHAVATDTLVLTAAQVDRELDRLSALHGPLDGFVGWTFLREFSLTFQGDAAGAQVSALRLERFSSQDHWTREFVGIGILRAPSTEPPGIRVEGFLSRSPAREAGLQPGDVIVQVDGQAVEGTEPLQDADADGQVVLGVRRGQASLTFTVAYEDLLPGSS
jgi:hypothetical protein